MNKKQIGTATICMAILALLLGAPLSIQPAKGAADIVALKTQNPVVVDGIPSETFWSQTQPTVLSLAGTTVYGGKVPEMWVRAAHDGKNIYILMQWPDTKESRTSGPARRLNLSTPGNLIGQYHANATHYYADAGLVTWWMGAQKPTVIPATNNEMGGSPTRRASLFGWTASDKAELWAWKSSALDMGNPYWPYAGLDVGVTTWHWGDNTGKPYTMPYSAAYQGLFNSTGYWILGDGLLHSKGCQQPGTKNFEVRARGVWNGGMWTLELSRPLVSSPENRPYTLSLESGNTYWAVFGAQDGNKGEWEEVASRSNWVSVELSNDLFPLEKQMQDVVAAAGVASKAAGDAVKSAGDASKVAGDASKVAGDAVKVAADASKAAESSVKAASDASKVAADAAKASESSVKTAGEAAKGADAAAKNSADAQKVSQDALSAAQQAIRAAEDTRKTAEATTNLAYGTIGIAIAAIIVSVVMGLRRRKP
ncbi:MAG: ethylbenzene dehydrogenase-related protein [Thaumarchaeota archaeon]|nr:ethylbenzene dehydrogenase-related protein [Nitrososphaerota archaeon]